ncbi:hypothetical protein [Pectobacterium punjabense]|uniref:hypothetical protein n=1 Tax=Pectobacterium punjabense TaxID=2108399 RepID=UPI00240564A6|nr:hypothetical protein [Pectobacterium punjabense]MDG0795691.1 hypothetical protein [Pectobacterium punjabense]
MTNNTTEVTTVNAASLAVDIAAHCAAFEKSDAYQQMIQEHVAKLYEKAIKDTFSWGTFPDAVRRALQSALPANITDVVDLPRYNLLLLKELATQWEQEAVSNQLVTEMREKVTAFITEKQIPKFIKASDLWAAFIEDHQEEAAQNGWQRPEVLMDYSEYGSFHVGLEKEPFEERSWSSAKRKTHPFEFSNNLYLSEAVEYENGQKKAITHDGVKCYSLYSGKCDGDTLGKKVIAFYTRFEKLVAALYYGDSLLVLDQDDADEVYYPGDY